MWGGGQVEYLQTMADLGKKIYFPIYAQVSNFCYGQVTFQTYKPSWLVIILSDINHDSTARLVSLF